MKLNSAIIRRCRLEMGLSQKQLADLLLCSVSAVSSWEAGRCYPHLALRSALIKAFHRSRSRQVKAYPALTALHSPKLVLSKRALSNLAKGS